MKSLFYTQFNWPLYILASIVIRLLFMDLGWLSYIAIMISIYQFVLLFNAIGYAIPVRYLLGSFMCVQFFIGPVLAYGGMDQYQYFMYKMQVPEEVYFSYALPAVVFFILGLHLNAGKLKGEVVDMEGIALFVSKNKNLPYFFIILGFLASIIGNFFSSDLVFLFYLLGSFKFIGLFLLVLGNKQLKPLPLTIVIGSIVSSSLGSGMFHDLLTWIIFSGAVFGIKYKFGVKVKLIGCFIFIVLAIVIQVMKTTYRSALGSGDGGLETFTDLTEEQRQEGGIFKYSTLANASTRINQGFIITNIMVTVPDREPFSNGAEMWQLFEAGIMPRFLAPNKLKAGDRAVFVKYSGIPLQEGTSMGLSSVGDAYINFGVIGGVIFMFLLGLMYSEVLNLLNKFGQKFPILILFGALIFYYPIRPDCEFQTILGHLFKSCFLIFAILMIWEHKFLVRKPKKGMVPVEQMKAIS